MGSQSQSGRGHEENASFGEATLLGFAQLFVEQTPSVLADIVWSEPVELPRVTRGLLILKCEVRAGRATHRRLHVHAATKAGYEKSHKRARASHH